MRIEQKLTIPIIFVIIGNILTGILNNKDLTYYILYVGIFLVFILLLFIKKIKFPVLLISNSHLKCRIKTLNIKMDNNVFSIIMLVSSIISMFLNDVSSLNSVFFFTYSIFVLKRSKNIYWVYGIIYGVCLLARYTFMDLSSSQIIVHLSGISFVLVSYQHYIHPKKTIKKELELNYINLPVKKSVIDILKLRILGFDWWEINDKLELTCTAKWTNEQVNKEMKLHGFKNRESFIYYLIENGAIKTKKPLSNTD